MIKNLTFFLLITTSYLTSIYLYAKQPYNSVYSYLLWLVSIILIIIFVLYKERVKINRIFNLKNFSFIKFLNKNKIITGIIILGIIVRFWNITSIPILTHDEAKDTGLFPQKIISGELKDYFGFYAGINNNFFVLSSIPHLIVTDPILKVRLFSALFGVLSILLIYTLAKSLYNKKTALISALFLSVYHIHIHFSRTEFLNLFDSFYTIVIILFFNLLAKTWKINYIILLAVVLGFGLHFYSGLRAIILLTIITFLIFSFVKLSFKKAVISSIVFFFFFLIALGPTLIVMATRGEEFRAAGTATFVYTTGSDLISTIKQILINYKDSILAYGITPIDFHYHYGGPFLTVPFSLFFLLGFLLTLRNIKKPVCFLLIIAVLAIPFFNSAIFNQINYTHRLLSLVPFIILLTAFGIEKFAKLLKTFTGKKIVLFFIGAICLYFVIYNLHLYFYDNVWEKTLNINEFRAWEAQKIINKEDSKNTITFFIGNTYYPSYKSVPPLEYLTQKYTIIDITDQKMFYQISDYRYYRNYLFIIMPNNNILFNKQALSTYLSFNKMGSKSIYYKNMYLFDILKITK